jgi:flagellar biosynthetic protein FliR
MGTTLQDFITQGVFAFMLTLVRMGTAVSIMPGLGDIFTPRNIRLYVALALSFALSPIVAVYLPHPVPQTPQLVALVAMEFIIGAFIGAIARFFLSALDTAGMLVSLTSGLGSAQLFNPGFQTQGSIVGSFLTATGVAMIFATNMYKLLFGALVGSYKIFPVGQMPDTGSMADMLARLLSQSFEMAVGIAAPFIIISLMLYIVMGVLSRLMPQIQVFMLALPLQITLSLLTVALGISGAMLFWLTKFQDGMLFFMKGG